MLNGKEIPDFCDFTENYSGNPDLIRPRSLFPAIWHRLLAVCGRSDSGSGSSRDFKEIIPGI